MDRVNPHGLAHGEEDGGQKQNYNRALHEHSHKYKKYYDEYKHQRRIGCDPCNKCSHLLRYLVNGNPITKQRGQGYDHHNGADIPNAVLQCLEEGLNGQFLIDKCAHKHRIKAGKCSHLGR